MLISSDMGVNYSLKIVENIVTRCKKEKISDADAIKQSIRCLEEYLESSERVRNASH